MPTAFGKALLRRAREVIDQSEEIRREIDALDQGHFRIGGPVDIGPRHGSRPQPEDRQAAQAEGGDPQSVGDQLAQIIQQVQALAPRIQMVNEGMQAQSTGAEQINQALVQLSEASSQTVDSLRQAGAAIDELNQVANNLRVGVSSFKV